MSDVTKSGASSTPQLSLSFTELLEFCKTFNMYSHSTHNHVSVTQLGPLSHTHLLARELWTNNSVPSMLDMVELQDLFHLVNGDGECVPSLVQTLCACCSCCLTCPCALAALRTSLWTC